MDIENNVVNLFPSGNSEFLPSKSEIETPIYSSLLEEAEKLSSLSKYACDFDYTAYKKLELRFKDRKIHGGIIKKNPLKLVNFHPSCQQCLYSLEVDTYGRGCIHNCLYCYAKAELTVHGMWNNPIPVPININEIRKIFYTVFETQKKSKWREILERRIPIRIGAMSDSFMWMDEKYRVSEELLKILNFYHYPFTIFTRSDLLSTDRYLKLLNPKYSSVQYSIASTNDQLNRKIEPGTPSAKKRLKAVKTINDAGIWTAVRINPIFPIFPDGYFSNSDFSWNGEVPKFEYSSFDMVDEIAEAGTKSIICGFGRFSTFGLNRIYEATGIDLKVFFDRSLSKKSSRDWHFSDAEVRAYYQKYKERCEKVGIEKTVCYIGNGESHFWGNRDLWSNKKDCCNIKDRVYGFKTDSREIPFETRLKFAGSKKKVFEKSANIHKSLENESINLDNNQVHPT